MATAPITVPMIMPFFNESRDDCEGGAFSSPIDIERSEMISPWEPDNLGGSGFSRTS
jgi:hypothetical protein